MKIKLFIVALCGCLLVSSSAFAAPVYIADNYVGGTPNSASYYGRDVIGNLDQFSISHMTVDFSLGVLKVDIHSTYFDNVGRLFTEMGDLFLSSDGWNPFGSAPYNDDKASNGEDWEYALVLDNHGESLSNDRAGYSMLGQSGTAYLYAVNQAFIELSSVPGGYIYRPGQEVQYNPLQQRALTAGEWSIEDLAGNIDVLHFVVDLDDAEVPYNGNWGYHWAMTCANDVIEGGSIPEPSTILLMGLSLLGGIRLKRSRSSH